MATQLTITVRDTDWDTLKDMADRQWREPSQQACALLEQVLSGQRARSGSAEKPHIDRRRGPRAVNGVAAAV